MKKTLIISYFYPPVNFVGAQRTASWAEHLHEFGYYPIVITRQWNKGQTDLVDKVTTNKLLVEKNKTHEVHRLPYRRSLRDKCSEYPLLRVIQKALTLKELVLSNFFLSALPYKNFYSYAKHLLENDESISIVLASGRPFHSFSIGSRLKQEFPYIHWVPDYRDEWNTNTTLKKKSFMPRLISKIEKRRERKWTQNATFFTSVSEHCINSIRNLIKKPGRIVLNGFNNKNQDQNTERNTDPNPKKELKIVYLGTVYDYQDFNIVLNAIRSINAESDFQITFTFLGSYSNQYELDRLDKSLMEYKDFVKLKPKVDPSEVASCIQKYDVTFLTEYENLKGCLPVKIFDYYKSNKPILLCPSDNGLMESFIEITNSGYKANTLKDCKRMLQNLSYCMREGKSLIGPRNEENAYKYSRKYQTKQLAKYFDELYD